MAAVLFYRIRLLVVRLLWFAMSLDHAGSGDWRPGDASSAVSSHAGASTTELLAELRAWAAEVDRSAPGARKAAAIQRQAVAAKARAVTHIARPPVLQKPTQPSGCRTSRSGPRPISCGY